MGLILARYVLQRLIVAVGLSLGGLGLVVLPPLFLSALSKLGGVGLGVVLGYLPLLSSELLPYLVPVGFLLAVVGTFSVLSARREWTAIQMAGVHPARVVLPALSLGFVFTATSMVLLHQIVPSIRMAQTAYRRASTVAVIRGLLKGKTAIQLGEFAVVGRRRVGNLFEDVVVRVPGTEQEPAHNVLADSVVITDEKDGLRIRLNGARVFEDNLDLRLDHMEIFLPIDRIARIRPPDPDNPTYLETSAIVDRLREGPPDDRSRRRLQYEIHMRTALSVSYLVFLLLGIPTGLRLSTESMLAPLGWTVVYTCTYYILFQRVGREMALSGELPVWAATWMANILGAGGAALMAWWRRAP